jgi:hypothetical protein
MSTKSENLVVQERENLIAKIEQRMDEFVDDKADWYPAYKVVYPDDDDLIYVSKLSANSSGYESFEIRFDGMGWGCDVDDNGNMLLGDPAIVTRLTTKEAEDVWQKLIVDHVVDWLRPGDAYTDPDNPYDEGEVRYQATLAFYEKVKGYNSHHVMEIMRQYNLD